MAIEIACSDLGIADCDFVARGETPADVVNQLARYLRKEKGINLPDTDVILQGDVGDTNAPTEAEGKAVVELVKRIRSRLHVGPELAAEPAGLNEPPTTLRGGPLSNQ